MAGKRLFAYWLKENKKYEVLKGEKIYKVAEEIGLTRPNLTQILNRKKPIYHKATAYAITKWTNSEYEIEDLFYIEKL